MQEADLAGQARLRHAVVGLLRRRVGTARMPIEGLNGPVVSKEITRGGTAAEFEAQAAPRVQRCVMTRLGQMLP